MWQNFVHLSIEGSQEVQRDEFKFLRSKDRKMSQTKLLLVIRRNPLNFAGFWR